MSGAPGTSDYSRVAGVAGDRLGLLLGLAGIEVFRAEDGEAAQRDIERLMEEGAGMVIVEEALQQQLSERFRDKLDRHKGLPLIVTCPEFDLDTSEDDMDDFVAAVIKPAVGYEIRLD
jgi:vacuolar-type H+-ATPase subunit F/Vma7